MAEWKGPPPACGAQVNETLEASGPPLESGLNSNDLPRVVVRRRVSGTP